MRKPREEKRNVDLLRPVTILDGEAGDCFGTDLYNPQDKDCSICADVELCGIKFQAVVQKKKKEFEEKHGPLLDQTDFAAVDMDKIAKLAQKYEDDQYPMLFQELVDVVAELACTKDETAVIEYLKRTLPTTNLIIKEGKVYAKRKDITN